MSSLSAAISCNQLTKIWTSGALFAKRMLKFPSADSKESGFHRKRESLVWRNEWGSLP